MPVRNAALGLAGAAVISFGLGGAACNGNPVVAYGPALCVADDNCEVVDAGSSAPNDGGVDAPTDASDGGGVDSGTSEPNDGSVDAATNDSGVDAATNGGEDAGLPRGIALYAGPPVPLYAPPPL